MLDDLFNKTQETEDFENELDSGVEESEDPDNKDSEWYNLDQEYIDLFVHILECKMKEIRNILNYN